MDRTPQQVRRVFEKPNSASSSVSGVQPHTFHSLEEPSRLPPWRASAVCGHFWDRSSEWDSEGPLRRGLTHQITFLCEGSRARTRLLPSPAIPHRNEKRSILAALPSVLRDPCAWIWGPVGRADRAERLVGSGTWHLLPKQTKATGNVREQGRTRHQSPRLTSAGSLSSQLAEVVVQSSTDVCGVGGWGTLPRPLSKASRRSYTMWCTECSAA